jgi:hypothetical protein
MIFGGGNNFSVATPCCKPLGVVGVVNNFWCCMKTPFKNNYFKVLFF